VNWPSALLVISGTIHHQEYVRPCCFYHYRFLLSFCKMGLAVDSRGACQCMYLRGKISIEINTLDHPRSQFFHFVLKISLPQLFQVSDMSAQSFILCLILAFSHIPSTTALHYKRASGSAVSLYAYGTNISGVEIFYGDGEDLISVIIFVLAIKAQQA
jgi:hypothetical protein